VNPIPAVLEATIRARLRERHTQGLALACFDSDGIRFAGGVGDADLARGEPVTPQTVFRVASISKLLTTTLVLSAVDAGLIDLDEPVNRYLPADLQITTAEGEPARSRVRTLLSHTPGLPAGARGADLGNPALTRIANAAPLRSLSDAISGLQLVQRPGERIIYSNVAFNVAGYVAGRAFGQPFEEAARTHVLEPLGMTDAAAGVLSITDDGPDRSIETDQQRQSWPAAGLLARQRDRPDETQAPHHVEVVRNWHRLACSASGTS